MAASAISIFPFTLQSSSSSSSSSSLPFHSFLCNSSSSSSSSSLARVSASFRCKSWSTHFNRCLSFKCSNFHPLLNGNTPHSLQQICRAAEYQFPDPIPEFADSETEKFRAHLVKKLSKKEETFGDSLDEVIGICTEIFSTFLHTEYGGPGTLLVLPFIDMADTLNEQELPGGPQAARAAVKWAQDHVDKDWKEWTTAKSSR